MRKLIVFLNPGHGIETSGKRSPKLDDGRQLFEWKFNRDIVSQLMGYSIPNLQWINVCPENTDATLQERVRRINRYILQNPTWEYLVLDVHGNAHGNGSNWTTASGIEVWTTPGQNNSDKVADLFLKEAAKLGRKIRKDTTDGDGDKENNWYIINAVSCPAILTENGFYTNEDECRWMLSHEGQMAIVGVHIATVVEWQRRAE